MKKSIVFYYRPGSVPPSAQPSFVVTEGANRSNQLRAMGLRAEVFFCGVETALERAKPRTGEIVLNSAPFR